MPCNHPHPATPGHRLPGGPPTNTPSRATDHQRPPRLRPPATGHRPPTTSGRHTSAGHRPPVTGHRPSATSQLTPNGSFYRCSFEISMEGWRTQVPSQVRYLWHSSNNNLSWCHHRKSLPKWRQFNKSFEPGMLIPVLSVADAMGTDQIVSVRNTFSPYT